MSERFLTDANMTKVERIEMLHYSVHQEYALKLLDDYIMHELDLDKVKSALLKMSSDDAIKFLKLVEQEG